MGNRVTRQSVRGSLLFCTALSGALLLTDAIRAQPSDAPATSQTPTPKSSPTQQPGTPPAPTPEAAPPASTTTNRPASQLPPVVVQVPQRPTVQRAAPARAAPAVRPRPQAPRNAPSMTAPATAATAGERGIGPVQGFAATRSVTATKTDTPILETPQSISVVTQDQFKLRVRKTSRKHCGTRPV